MSATSSEGVTPATQGGSAWGEVGSLLKDLGSKAGEYVLKSQEAKANAKLASQLAKNSPTPAPQTSGFYISPETKKLIVAGIVVIGLVAGFAVAMKFAKK